MHADWEALSGAAHVLQNSQSVHSSLNTFFSDTKAEKDCFPSVDDNTFFFCVYLFWTDPVFVGSAYIEESQPVGNPVGDDDKIYFFFSEAGKEFDFFDNTIVSRIARVCKVRHLGFGSLNKATTHK